MLSKLFFAESVSIMGDIFNIGVNVTAAGILIVFAMLVLLVLVIGLFTKLMSAKKEEAVSAPRAASAPAAAPKAVSAPVQASAEDPDEIIAVIAAAVEAMYAGSGKRAVVRAVKPAAATYHKPWAVAGIYENTIAF